jgi:hypothetical protein
VSGERSHEPSPPVPGRARAAVARWLDGGGPRRLARACWRLLRVCWRSACEGRRWLLDRLDRKTRRRVGLLGWVALATSPVWALNLAVWFFGHSFVFPLSPFFLRAKLSALGSYAAHRPLCLLRGHPDIGPLVASAELRYRLPRGLLAAVVQVESGGRPHSISTAGAMGPAQLMPGTALHLGVADPFDSAENVDGAARLLAEHLARFHSLRLAIAAYHAGPAAAGNGVPENGVTPGYVARVLAARAALRPRRQSSQATEGWQARHDPPLVAVVGESGGRRAPPPSP